MAIQSVQYLSNQQQYIVKKNENDNPILYYNDHDTRILDENAQLVKTFSKSSGSKSWSSFPDSR